VFSHFLAGQAASIGAFNHLIAELLRSRLSRWESSESPADSIRAIYNELAAHRVESFLLECRRDASSAGRAAGLTLIASENNIT